MTEDLLGPGWRGHGGRAVPEEAAPGGLPDVSAAVDAAATVEAVLAGISLTPAERALWDAYQEADDWSAAGNALGLTRTNLTTRKARLRKKLAPLRESLRTP